MQEKLENLIRSKVMESHRTTEIDIPNNILPIDKYVRLHYLLWFNVLKEPIQIHLKEK